jgi:hypothetical protein
VNDSVALDSASAVLGDAVLPVSTAVSAIEASDVVIITTPAPEFAALQPDPFVAGGRERIVVDCWRILRPEISSVANVLLLGRGPSREAVVMGDSPQESSDDR